MYRYDLMSLGDKVDKSAVWYSDLLEKLNALNALSCTSHETIKMCIAPLQLLARARFTLDEIVQRR